MLHNDNNIAVKVTDLGKAYRIGVVEEKEENLSAVILKAILSPVKNFRKIKSLKNISSEATGKDVFWANRNISFEVKKGEVLGIIGKNGAGKSTLLKMLSRITEPTEGRIELVGRVASLLEVGTGFNPELTGRENIFLNGTILGLTKKEIEERYESIVEFSGIEKFIETPVKRYSSGMKVRLAFAVAAHLDPEILIIDEVLAVGDAEFQKKCLGKMQDVAGKEGRTVLFVSHDMAAVKNLCNRAILLQHGSIVFEGSANDVVNYYLQNAASITSQSNLDFSQAKGNKNFVVTDIEMLDENNNNIQIAESGRDFQLKISYETKEVAINPVVIILVKNNLEQVLFTCLSRNSYNGTMQLNSQGSIICNIPKLPLLSGLYTLDIVLKYDQEVTFSLENIFSFEVEKGDFFGTGKINDDMMNGMIINHNWVIQ
ncbi:MAG TPA: ABC transporter ATP-binding protein [Chitinophagaceae bacterium]|nr:ABC transporter ATP-binding protein [Chitinophagaceae bacterium]HMZ45210.1 ABC transporter ATP-binding protein [Chitinophagaceae bacterium]HNF29025.1 ABC transporter ATP-binding protein [Chitinophagaceae bacterium]HNJ57887.1 ABC transporter ATP-binding protein [Chitinophagaceae bacterium]HNL82883.1 ABC transporter ATP-binding protein [Chitinophagaceae bacterium]